MRALILFVAAALLLAGCAAPGATQQTNTTTQPSGSGTSGTQGQPSGTGQTTDLNTCLSDCLTLTDSGLQAACKAGCNMNVAEQSLDASKCDPILALGENMSLFWTTCIWNVAEKKGDASLCGKLNASFDQGVCLSDVAKTKHDPSICNGINDTYLKESCVSDASGNSSQ